MFQFMCRTVTPPGPPPPPSQVFRPSDIPWKKRELRLLISENLFQGRILTHLFRLQFSFFLKYTWQVLFYLIFSTSCYKVRPFLEHSCAILSFFKIVIIFNTKSADFVLISADVILKMITILKGLRILRNCVLKMDGLHCN